MNSTVDPHAIATAGLHSHLERAKQHNGYAQNQRRKQVQENAPEVASSSPVAVSPIRIRTPQRKARYHDKNRLRLHSLKAAVLLNANCSNTGQIRALLKVLGVSLDLRYTSSWLAINLELMPLIKRIVEQQNKASYAVSNDPISTLISAMKDAITTASWHPVQAALATHGEYKQEAWKQLSTTEKQQLTALVPEPLRLLSQAKRRGAIASFKEDPEGDIYWVWRTSNAQPELVTSCFVKIFVRNLVTSGFLDVA